MQGGMGWTRSWPILGTELFSTWKEFKGGDLKILFLPFAQPQWENCFLKEDFVPENKLKSKLFIQMKKSLPRLLCHCSHCQYFHLRPEFIFYKISQKLEMLLLVDENLQSQAHWMIKSLHFCIKIGAFHIWKWNFWPFMISQYFWK